MPVVILAASAKLVAVVAVPVKLPTNPLTEVVTPETLSCDAPTLLRVVTPDTESCVTEAIPPITLVDTPELLANPTLKSAAAIPLRVNAVVANDAVDAVPVKLPTKVGAVTIPEALIFLTTAKSFSVNWTDPAASLVPDGN